MWQTAAARVLQAVPAQPFTSLRCFSPAGPKPFHFRGMRPRCSAAEGAGGAPDGAAPVSADAAAAELAPGLYLVATPIGNLEDITLRALRVLRSADRVLCEDTRHTSRLLSHYGIRTPLESYHQHNERSRESGILHRLRQGGAIALVSDAGMPAINDPGADLVAKAVAEGLPVVPIPGASAVLTALVASGLPTAEFIFCGFLAPKSGARRKQLAALQGLEATALFFVSPHALLAALEDAAAVLGPERRCCVARELTKLHEEFYRDSLAGALAEFTARGPRGEVTLVIQGVGGPGGAAAPEVSDAEIVAALERAVAGGQSPSQAAKAVAAALGASRKHVYALSLGMQPEEDSQD